MSPEEWAFKISELIKEAEADTGWQFVNDPGRGFFLEKFLSHERGYAEVRLDL